MATVVLALLIGFTHGMDFQSNQVISIHFRSHPDDWSRVENVSFDLQIPSAWSMNQIVNEAEIMMDNRQILTMLFDPKQNEAVPPFKYTILFPCTYRNETLIGYGFIPNVSVTISIILKPNPPDDDNELVPGKEGLVLHFDPYGREPQDMPVIPRETVNNHESQIDVDSEEAVQAPIHEQTDQVSDNKSTDMDEGAAIRHPKISSIESVEEHAPEENKKKRDQKHSEIEMNAVLIIVCLSSSLLIVFIVCTCVWCSICERREKTRKRSERISMIKKRQSIKFNSQIQREGDDHLPTLALKQDESRVVVSSLSLPKGFMLIKVL